MLAQQVGNAGDVGPTDTHAQPQQGGAEVTAEPWHNSTHYDVAQRTREPRRLR